PSSGPSPSCPCGVSDKWSTKRGPASSCVHKTSTRDDKIERVTEKELAAARAGCNRFLNGHGVPKAADLLASIPPEVETDRYGSGGVVQELEAEVASTLGKPAALFLPSGTMAQQATLRVHADRRGRRDVVFHPMCHLDWHEGRGYQRLHGLVGIPAGEPTIPMTRSTLDGMQEPPAAL